MEFLLAEETCVPIGDSRFRIEKWVPEEDFLLEFDNKASSDADEAWAVQPYYRLFKLDGTELMETTTWSDVVGYLEAVGGNEVPKDFGP